MSNQNAAVAAIQFALETDDGLTFLRLWNHGDFDKTRRDWPEAPEAVYIGADPLHRETAPPGATINSDTSLLDFTEQPGVMIDGSSASEDGETTSGWYVNGETYPGGMSLRQCLSDAMCKRAGPRQQ